MGQAAAFGIYESALENTFIFTRCFRPNLTFNAQYLALVPATAGMWQMKERI